MCKEYKYDLSTANNVILNVSSVTLYEGVQSYNLECTQFLLSERKKFNKDAVLRHSKETSKDATSSGK